MTPDTTAPSYLLALNAAEGLLQIVIARREEDGAWIRLCAQSWHAPSQGAEMLAPALADACERLRITPRAIGRIAAVRGPGSFTGLRLALATASGLARANRALRAGLDYLPLLASSALRAALPWPPETAGEQTCPAAEEAAAPPGTVWALTHARRNLVHAQAFEEERPLSDVLVCTPEEAAGHITRSSYERHGARRRPPLVLGSGLTRNRAALAGALNATLAEHARTASGAHGPHIPLLLSRDFDHPSPDALLEAATRAVYSEQEIAPLYIRPADAVGNLESIAASLGLDPEAAKKRLGELTE